MAPEISKIIEVAESMIEDLPIVRSRPLIVAQDFVGKIDDWDEYPQEIKNLLDAIESVEWSFFPQDEFGSNNATVDIYNLIDVSSALDTVKELF